MSFVVVYTCSEHFMIFGYIMYLLWSKNGMHKEAKFLSTLESYLQNPRSHLLNPIVEYEENQLAS